MNDDRVFIQVFVLLFVHGLLGCNETTLNASSWGYENYPNPQREPERCGRNRSSLVCDPDSLLTDTQADKIDKLLQAIQTSDPCFCDVCNGKGGLKFSIALVGRVKSDSNDVLSYLKKFSEWLKDVSWKVGSCEDDVYIVVSDYDKMVYVETGSRAGKYIDDKCVTSAVRNARRLQCKIDYYNLLHDLIRQLRNISLETKSGVEVTCKTDHLPLFHSCIIYLLTFIYFYYTSIVWTFATGGCLIVAVCLIMLCCIVCQRVCLRKYCEHTNCVCCERSREDSREACPELVQFRDTSDRRSDTSHNRLLEPNAVPRNRSRSPKKQYKRGTGSEGKNYYFDHVCSGSDLEGDGGGNRSGGGGV